MMNFGGFPVFLFHNMRFTKFVLCHLILYLSLTPLVFYVYTVTYRMDTDPERLKIEKDTVFVYNILTVLIMAGLKISLCGLLTGIFFSIIFLHTYEVEECAYGSSYFF